MCLITSHIKLNDSNALLDKYLDLHMVYNAKFLEVTIPRRILTLVLNPRVHPTSSSAQTLDTLI